MASTSMIERAKKKSDFRKTVTPYMYLVPAFLVMAVITFYPLIYQVVVSFTDFQTKDLLRGLASEKLNQVGVQNYVDILAGGLPVQNFDFFRVLTYNLWWAITNVALHVPAGIVIAVLLNTPGLWMKRIYRSLYILPVVIPPLVVATVWRNIFDEQYGAMNQFLTSAAMLFGSIDPVRIRWLEDFTPPIAWLLPNGPLTLAYYAMMIANFWLGWPFMTLVATGALQSIPKDLYEAASIDGASAYQQFMNITVPLLRPAMIPATIYGFTTSFNLFSFVFFMTGGGPARSTEILVTFAYDLVRNLRLYGAAAAFSVIVFFVALIIFLITNRLTKATENIVE
ncbi:MAG TPA: sugar ABC transporter permease [Anaerolineales bacterium]|nr:sugar ABC transporter permease [Anaerolineales bacterium]HMR98474.1 sugar ABC transporter permease [Anaerolineales bacterium]HNS60082.1 sugar ABC transporter permease [Anaerolineales bacterium]